MKLWTKLWYCKTAPDLSKLWTLKCRLQVGIEAYFLRAIKFIWPNLCLMVHYGPVKWLSSMYWLYKLQCTDQHTGLAWIFPPGFYSSWWIYPTISSFIWRKLEQGWKCLKKYQIMTWASKVFLTQFLRHKNTLKAWLWDYDFLPV